MAGGLLLLYLLVLVLSRALHSRRELPDRDENHHLGRAGTDKFSEICCAIRFSADGVTLGIAGLMMFLSCRFGF